MKHFTRTKKLAISLKLFILTASIWLCGINSSAQSVMYGDTIFWENFGTGTTRADITGRGSIGGLYLYAGELMYVCALNTTVLSAYITANSNGSGGDYDWIQDTPKFKEVPITTSSAQYTAKPAAGAAEPYDGYWTVTSWKDWTFSSKTTLDTDDYAATQFRAGAEDTGPPSNNYPCSWVKINGVWKFGFYYGTYSYNETERVPNDGYYALVNDGDNLTGADNYLQNHWKDHSGWDSLSMSPLTPADSVADNTNHTGTGRYLFVNCSQSGSITGAVYKRQVTELCRDAMFEFSIWVASVHGSSANTQFRIEIWSEDPGEDPSLGGLTVASEGLDIAEANNARLIALGDKTTVSTVGYWQQILKTFTLTEQDYCWVVVRNYGTGSGNDIAIDDLVFKPYAPFNLTIELSAEVLSGEEMACNQGLVSMISSFPVDMPAYINIEEFGFFFQGQNGTSSWTTIGNAIPIQTQSADEPLELTLPLAEYNLYDRYRVIVATTPAGFGGRCITFTYPPVDKEVISNAPEFTITGVDVCGNGSGTQTGKYIITNTNQAVNNNNWVVKLRLPDGSIVTHSPQAE